MIRVFPRRTKWTPDDDLAFIGDPGLFLPENQPVRISCSFTWDIPEIERLYRAWSAYYDDVEIGGPAFGDPGAEFEPGVFLKKGITITSRGCPKECPWCFVHPREGDIRELVIKDGWILQDNNILACSFEHVQAVFKMLARQPVPITFHGGLDAEFLTERHVPLFDMIRFRELWFACDHLGAVSHLEKAGELFSHLHRNKKRCYVLVGFEGEKLHHAERRLEKVWDLGFLPFAMPYQGDEKTVYDDDWKRLIKTFSRPAATKAHMKRRRPDDTGASYFRYSNRIIG